MEEQNKHRMLWKRLKLTCEGPTADGDRDGALVGGLEHGDAHPQGGDGVDQQWGRRERPHIGTTAGDGPEHLDITKCGQNLQNLQNVTKEGIFEHLPGGRGQPGHGGEEHGPVVIKKRRYHRKLKGGQSRDGIKQLDISMYAVPKIMGEGGSLAERLLVTETETENVGGRP